jgi:ATP-dependent Clp protease ATP-binding subunit ClpA
MPQTVKLPFHVVKLRLANGEEIAMPLSDSNAYHLRRTAKELAQKYGGSFQKKLLDQGNYLSVLDELRDGDFQKKKLTVDFPASKDGISYPAFELEFDYFFETGETGVWAILPALSVEAMAGDPEELEDRLRDAVKVEFTSKKRLQSVHQIIAAHWFEGVDIERSEISLKFHSPAELIELQKEKKQSLLSKVAEKLEVRQPSAYGREKELASMERMLKSRFSRNILIVGASGTGKTALVWELARRKKELGIEAHIWETTASVLIKELTQDTGWQDNLSHLVKELTLTGGILFIRNLSELFEVGRYEGNAVSIAEYLQPFLSRGEITMIAECTPEERARIEVRSPNYLAFFQIVQLQEPKDDLEEIISKKINDIAGQRSIELEPEAVREIVRLHRRFSPYSGMPGKPVRFLESILLGNPKPGDAQVTAIRRSTVLKHFSEESGLPQFMIDPALPMDTEAIRQLFNKNVFGQEHAVNTVVDMLAAVKTALTRTGKPIASFLFVGPTGVGKTELAKILAEFMFGSRERMLRFDMSEFSKPWLVTRLTGQGFYSDGLLTSAVRREPFCVLLFDEIEKADPAFFELLLQMLSEGRLSDSRGRLVNFCSAIIIMTSNIGAEKMQRRRIGWSKELDAEEITHHFTKAVEDNFRPELFNRIDSIVAFRPLTRQTVRYVVEREVDLFKKREGIQFRHLELNIADDVLDFLAETGYEARYGARYLQRTIRERLLVPLARKLNEYPFDDRLMVNIFLENQELNILVESDPLGFDLLMEQWDKLTLAEQTSFLRRKMMLTLEGPLLMRFQSELDMLEQEKRFLGLKFWENVPRAGVYTNMLTVNDQFRQLHQSIQNLEVEIALACMDQDSFQPDFSERLEQWESAFFDLRVSLHSLLFPRLDTCHFAIYGAGLEAPLRFYLELFKTKNFLVKKATAIWFRENTPGGKTEDLSPLVPAENGSGQAAEEETPPMPVNYLHQELTPESLNDLNFKPPRKDARLYGIELELSAACIWRYLKDEKGFQHWESAVKNEFMPFSIQPHLNFRQTPEGIHRFAFYNKHKPHRTVRNGYVIDSRLNISREMPLAEMPGFFIEKLDETYKNAIEEVFLTGEPND